MEVDSNNQQGMGYELVGETMNIIPIITTDSDARKDSLVQLLPSIFTDQFKTILYVGAQDEHFTFSEELKNAQYIIDIIEINQHHCKILEKKKWINNVVNIDVQKYKTDKKYDIVMWWHGPEHIEDSNLNSTLKNLESIASEYIILGCPWGISPMPGHLQTINENQFEILGYTCIYSGIKDTYNRDNASGIVAVKRKIW